MNPNAYKQTKLELTEGDRCVMEIIGDFAPDNVFDATPISILRAACPARTRAMRPTASGWAPCWATPPTSG